MLGLSIEVQPGFIVAILVTLGLIVAMFRPLETQNDFMGFGVFEAVFRLFYLIPILIVWLVYFIAN